MLPLLVPSSAGDCAAARLSSWRATAGGRQPWRSRLRLRGLAGGGSTTATPLRCAPSSISGRRGHVPVVVPGIDVVHNLLLILVLVLIVHVDHLHPPTLRIHRGVRRRLRHRRPIVPNVVGARFTTMLRVSTCGPALHPAGRRPPFPSVRMTGSTAARSRISPPRRPTSEPSANLPTARSPPASAHLQALCVAASREATGRETSTGRNPGNVPHVDGDVLAIRLNQQSTVVVFRQYAVYPRQQVLRDHEIIACGTLRKLRIEAPHHCIVAHAIVFFFVAIVTSKWG